MSVVTQLLQLNFLAFYFYKMTICDKPNFTSSYMEPKYKVKKVQVFFLVKEEVPIQCSTVSILQPPLTHSPIDQGTSCHIAGVIGEWKFKPYW